MVVEQSKRFHNELGNLIGLQVTKQVGDGGSGRVQTRVRVLMNGPMSGTDHVMTLIEATELHDVLGRVLAHPVPLSMDDLPPALRAREEDEDTRI